MNRAPNSETWLITGASGLLGQALARHLVGTGARVCALALRHDVPVSGVETRMIDLADTEALTRIVQEARPAYVVHAAGLTDVDACERDEARALAVHAGVCHTLAHSAPDARLIYISTDHLWDGTRPMVGEDEPPRPLNAYARTKLAGEHSALESAPGALVIRTNFFGPGCAWRQSFSDWILDRLASGTPIPAFDDVFFTPIAYNLLCPLLLSLVHGGQSGVWHLAGGERLSKLQFALRLAQKFGYPPELIRSGSVNEAGLAAPRPRDMSLSTAKAAAYFGRPLPSIEESFATLPAAEATKQKGF